MAAAPLPAPAPPSAHVDATGCVWTSRVTDPVVLSYDASDKAAMFASVRVPGEARLGTGTTSTPPSAEIDVFGLHLDTQSPTSGFKLHARAALGLAGVFDPDSFTPLLFTHGSDPAIVVHARIDDRDGRIRALVPIEKPVACAEVAPDVGHFAARTLPKARSWAKGKEPLSLAPQPDATPAVVLPRDAIVAVHATRGASSEISYEGDGGLWHGFTPTKALVTVPAPGGVGYGTGSGRGGPTTYAGFTCPRELPLYVRKVGTAAALARVGHVRTGAHVAFVEASDDPLRALAEEQRKTSADRGTLTLQKGFELVVDRDEAKACRADEP